MPGRREVREGYEADHHRFVFPYQSGTRRDIRAWCHQHLRGWWSDDQGTKFWIQDDRDAMLMKLQWSEDARHDRPGEYEIRRYRRAKRP